MSTTPPKKTLLLLGFLIRIVASRMKTYLIAIGMRLTLATREKTMSIHKRKPTPPRNSL
jgi:hypothetical protein